MANVKIDKGADAPHHGVLAIADLHKEVEARRTVNDVLMHEIASRVPNLKDKIANPKGFHISFSWG